MHSACYATASNLAGKAEAWLARVRATVAPRPHLRIDPAAPCALLVIDMLQYFAGRDGRCFLPATEAIVPRIAALLAAWREAEVPVIYTRHAHEGEHDLGMLGRFFDDYIRAGEPESEIVAPLAPRAGETVIRKITYDAFLDTGLQEMLATRGCRQVLVTGVLTHMCCETTARSAFCRGFEVYVAADGTASSTEDLHVGALLGMGDAVAVVMGVDEVLSRCRKPS